MTAAQGPAFGALLRQQRRSAGLTQEELAEQASLSVRAVSDLERGLKYRPRKDTVQLLADALGLRGEEREVFETAGRRAGRPAVESVSSSNATLPQTAQVQTFLIADMRGYTRFTLEQGDEAAARLAARFAEMGREVVTARDGEVIELRGDEALSVFSSTRAALWAAVELQARCAQEGKDSLPLGVGIGIDAGEAIPVEGGFRGAALNLAARLCSLAGPGEVLASDTVVNIARKVDGLAYSERGTVQLKGFAEPVRVMQVGKAVSDQLTAVRSQSSVVSGQLSGPSRQRPGRFPSSSLEGVAEQGTPQAGGKGERGLSQQLPIGGFLGSLPAGPLVAREKEVGHMLAAVAAVERGEGRLILLAGEPGAGKTRLAQEVSLQARNRGFVIAAGSCFEQRQTVPYYPFLDTLASLYGAAPESIHLQITRRWPSLAGLLPEAPLPLPIGSANGQEDQERLFLAVTGFVRALADHAPVALLLDDLHWADESSLDLISHLARHTRGHPVLLLGTYRDVEVKPRDPMERALRDLHRSGLSERITVRRLDQIGTAELMAASFGEAEVSEEFVALVYRHTEGNPFFTGEVLRALVERGDVFRRDGVWDRREIGEIQVPDSVRSAVGERLSRLEQETQELLEEAAVLGQTFSFEALQRMGKRLEAEVEAGLEEAWRVGLIREIDPETYGFHHALIQGTLYAELPGRKKRRMHLAAGVALERLSERKRRPEETRPSAELAWHFREGGDPVRAGSWATLAGDRAQGVFAYGEAERHYQLAQQLAKETGDEGREAEALEKLGDVLERLLRHDEARASYESALGLTSPSDRLALSRLHQKIGYTWNAFGVGFAADSALREYSAAEQALGEAPGEPDVEWQRAWLNIQCGRSSTYYAAGRASETTDLLRSLRLVVQEAGTPEQRADVFLTLANLTLQRERYGVSDEALGYMREALEATKQLGDAWRTVGARFCLGFHYLWHGDLDEAEETLRATLRAAEEIDEVEAQAQCLTYLTTTFRKRSQVDLVRDYAPRCQAAAIPARTPQYVAMADAHLSRVAWREGDLEEAEARARAALDRWEDQDIGLYRLVYWMAIWPLLGVALVQSRLPDAADHARALIAPTMQPMPDNLAAALAAAIAAWDRGDAAASAHLHRAAHLAQDGGYL